MRNLQTGLGRAVKKSFLPIFFSISFSLLALKTVPFKMVDNKGVPLSGSSVTVKDISMMVIANASSEKGLLEKQRSACKDDINKRLKT